MATKKNRILIVGDVHGCYDELILLLDKMDYDPLHDRLIFVGDVINRGPKSFDVLKFISTHQCEVVKGNHEVAFLRYAKNLKSHPNRQFDEILQAMGEEKEQWIKWMDSWPLYLESSDFLVVHGGLCPGQNPQETSSDILTRIRTWDGEGRNMNDLSNLPWDHYYKGKKLVVFGHWSQRGLVVKKNVIGLDSGCVWGGSLSGVVLPEREIFQVPAIKSYQSI